MIDEKLEVRRVKHPQWRIRADRRLLLQEPAARLAGPGRQALARARVASPAGQLLDECDCRGLRVGDAMVFAKHANILVNAGRATAREVLELAEDDEAPRAREVRGRARGRGYVPRRAAPALGEEVAAWTSSSSCSGSVLAAAPAAAPPVQLVETRPVETRLGDPSLPQARDVWVEMIRGAERTLDLEQFYLSTWPGEPLEEVLEAIGQAARRGVRVRLILDARMHDTYPRTADSLGAVPGMAVRLIDMAKVAGGGVQHAKYFLVDGREMFIGSQNLDWRALSHIHEMGLRIRDARTVAAFQDVFEMDWAASDSIPTRPAPAVEVDSARTRPARAALDTARVAAGRRALSGAPRLALPIRIVQAPGDTVELTPGYAPLAFVPDSALWDRDAIVRLIDSARHEFIVTLLSYGRGREDDAVDQALRRAGGARRQGEDPGLGLDGRPHRDGGRREPGHPWRRSPPVGGEGVERRLHPLRARRALQVRDRRQHAPLAGHEQLGAQLLHTITQPGRDAEESPPRPDRAQRIRDQLERRPTRSW